MPWALKWAQRRQLGKLWATYGAARLHSREVPGARGAADTSARPCGLQDSLVWDAPLLCTIPHSLLISVQLVRSLSCYAAKLEGSGEAIPRSKWITSPYNSSLHMGSETLREDTVRHLNCGILNLSYPEMGFLGGTGASHLIPKILPFSRTEEIREKL